MIIIERSWSAKKLNAGSEKYIEESWIRLEDGLVSTMRFEIFNAICWVAHLHLMVKEIEFRYVVYDQIRHGLSYI